MSWSMFIRDAYVSVEEYKKRETISWWFYTLIIMIHSMLNLLSTSKQFLKKNRYLHLSTVDIRKLPYRQITKLRVDNSSFVQRGRFNFIKGDNLILRINNFHSYKDVTQCQRRASNEHLQFAWPERHREVF